MSDLSNTSLMDLFRIEVDQHVAALNDGLVLLAAGNSSRDTLNALMRAAHSIKGAARIVGLQVAVDIAHAIEDCFVTALEGRGDLHADRIEVILKGVDQLSRIGRLSQQGDGSSPELQREASQIVLALGTAKRKGGNSSAMHLAVTGGSNAKKPPTNVISLAAPPAKTSDRIQPPKDLSDIPLMELFRTEVQSHAETLLKDIADLTQSSLTTTQLENCRRAAHSIKGAARIVGVNAAVDVAAAIERVFADAFEGKVPVNASQAGILRSGVEVLQRLAHDGEAVTPQQIADFKNILSATVLSNSTRAEQKSPAPENKAPVHDVKPPTTKSSGRLRVQSSSQLPQIAEVTTKAQISTRIASTPGSDRKSTRMPIAADRAVRVNALSLNRLMGLAGEYRVETRWLEPFASSLRHLKSSQLQLADLLERLESLDRAGASEALRLQLLYDTQQQRAICEQQLNACISDFEQYAYRSDNLAHRLYREVIASRMRPFADGVQGFPRMVHDLAKKLGKKVRFEILGKTTEVDRDILDKLEAPLNHLLRNALDHGVEFPQDRVAAGKPEMATLVLEASHKGGMLAVSVSDDGRGIDLEMLRKAIITKRLSQPELVAKMSDAELLDFLFLPGFSTAGAVTEISGRGVGLDIVQNMAQETGGQIRVSTTLGKGTSFHLQLPITLSVLRALLVDIAGEPYAFPLARIDRILNVPQADVRSLENQQYVTVDGQHVGLVPAHQVLDLPPVHTSKRDLPVVVIAGRNARYGLAVDKFIGERDVVVRPIDQRLGKVQNLSASALMEDGAPLLILDVEDMIHSIDAILSGGRLRRVTSQTDKVEKRVQKRILVVDDSLTVREVERKLLENKGYKVDLAADGMEGWHAVRAGSYDLVISDVDMPRMNGIEFVSHIKKDQRLKDIPVMIVSYKDREEDRLRGLEAGANYYLAKSSFHDESLINAVVDLIGQPLGERSEGRSR